MIILQNYLKINILQTAKLLSPQCRNYRVNIHHLSIYKSIKTRLSDNC